MSISWLEMAWQIGKLHADVNFLLPALFCHFCRITEKTTGRLAQQRNDSISCKSACFGLAQMRSITIRGRWFSTYPNFYHDCRVRSISSWHENFLLVNTRWKILTVYLIVYQDRGIKKRWCRFLFYRVFLGGKFSLFGVLYVPFRRR